MKKTLLLLSCMALMGTVASAKLTGNNFGDINAKDEVLKLQVKGRVHSYVGAWWKPKRGCGFDLTQKKVIDLGDMLAGAKFPSIPKQEIHVVAPRTDDVDDNVRVKFETTPIVFKRNGVNKGTLGKDKFEIDVTMEDKNGGSASGNKTLILDMDTDNAGRDDVAVNELFRYWGVPLGPVSEYLVKEVVGGEVVELSFDTNGKRVPYIPGKYTGDARITVSLLK